MTKDKQNEIIAKIVLSEYERKEKLRKIIDESFWHYSFGRLLHCIGMLILLIILVRSIYIPGTYYYWSFSFFVFILNELNRQNNRFKAFVRLSEIEKEEKNEDEVVSPNSDSAAAKSE